MIPTNRFLLFGANTLFLSLHIEEKPHIGLLMELDNLLVCMLPSVIIECDEIPVQNAWQSWSEWFQYPDMW